MSENFGVEFSKLGIWPGDVIIARVKEHYPVAAQKEVQKELSEQLDFAFPENRHMIIFHDVDFSTVRTGERIDNADAQMRLEIHAHEFRKIIDRCLAEFAGFKKERLSKEYQPDDENGTHRNPIYSWSPKVDITPYELAACMPVLTGYSMHNIGEKYYIETLPEQVRRHFKRHE